ncbi:MAG TPA: DUF3592 domain-containing protein [Vicinamibacterales bacterium]
MSEEKAYPIGAAAAGILLFIVGLIVGMYAFQGFRNEQDRLAIAARAAGTVTGHLNGHPMVTFTLPGGDRVSFTASSVSGAYPDGTKVDVLYQMDQPSNAIIDRPFVRWGRFVALGALSGIVMGLGAYIARAARRHDRMTGLR